jgi:hypothetical protein
MNLNSENKQAIHDVLITDMQKRLYESVNEDLTHKNKRVVPFEDYTTALEVLVDEILLTQSLNDINELLVRYDYLFPEEYLTLDGTLNYVIALFVSEIYALEKAYEFNDMFN